ncbi:Glutamate receptor 2.2 [Thalictrum thalictroides]|uniref:Glutamate receptor 2.2 n=1 Tax=Thalictrum thalictroides TaxID=46969 RepID=A0A7J6W4J3_THATH|nr:Glutamate receptor 2.2 [Thalictrum thalictroides]
MVVTAKSQKTEEGWIFLRPFTKELWIAMIFMSIFTGFVIWMHESEKNPEFKLATILWFPVSTLFFAHREPIENNLARIVVGTWLFVVLIVISSYTAILTSMFTVARLEPSMVNVEFLKKTHASVGCNGNSFIVRYLVDVVGFKKENVKRINSIDDYPSAFQNKDIAAAFFVTLHAKVFLMKNCEGYTMTGPTYKLGGFGFVFPKGSPLAFDISEAILKATEGGEIQMLEDNMLSSNNCSNSLNKIGEVSVLGPKTFRVPFILSASVSVVTIFINIFSRYREYREHMRLLLEHIIIWGRTVIDNVKNSIRTACHFFWRIYGKGVKKPDDVDRHGTIELAIQNITPS